MRVRCGSMLVLGFFSGWIGLPVEPAVAQGRRPEGKRPAESRLSPAEGILRQLAIESGVGVTLGTGGTVEVTIPEVASPFSQPRVWKSSGGTRVETGPQGTRVLATPTTPGTGRTETPRIPAEVHGLLEQFAPQLRLNDRGVEVRSAGIRLDTRDGVNVELETPQGPVRVSQRAIEDYTAARQAFSHRDYPQALQYMESAVERMPREARFRQFRSLTYFALGEFAPAADDAYHALALESPWDWATVRACYGESGEYTAQYRRLQRAARDHEQAPELQFLLAYHYTLLGHQDAARQAWKRVDQLLPNDPVILSQIRQFEERPAVAEILD